MLILVFLLLFLALGVIGTVLLATIPSTERATTGDIIVVWGAAGLLSFFLYLLVAGFLSIIG